MGRSPVAGTVNRKGEPGRTPNTRAPLMRGLGDGFGVNTTAGSRTGATGFRLAFRHHDPCVGPVRVVEANAIPGVPHRQHEQSSPRSEATETSLACVAPAQHAAFPEDSCRRR